MALFFAPIIGLFSNVIFQILGYRFFFKKKLLNSIVFGFLIGGIVSLSFKEIDCLLTYIFLSYSYFNFLNLGETGRRIRLLRELKDAGSGLTYEEIIKCYNREEIILRRLNRLLKTRQIVERNNRLYIGNPIMLIAAQVLVMLKVVLLGRRSEIE